jgi:ubiquinone/menaquinone biosynthesis C-methylase UbiE
MTVNIYANTTLKTDNLISHKQNSIENVNYNEIRKRLKQNINLTLPLEETLKIFDNLIEFEIGRFLLKNRGLNGYWTSYIILHGPKLQNLNPLEAWLLNYAPTVKATRERYGIFKDLLQENIRSDMVMASIPCGVMDDLLSLDYTGFRNVKLIGIDLDKESLSLAQQNIKTYVVDKEVKFIHQNAWELSVVEEYDIITSNGLNIYEHDDEKVIELYKNFYKTLRPSGILITSFLTPPPALNPDSTWKNIDLEALKKQKAIFADILQVKWQAFRTEAQTKEQLEKAGFKDIKFIYDSQGMFPTVVAKKK